MKLYWAMALALGSLAGCKAQQPAPVPSSAAADAAPTIPVVGAEQRVLALGDSLFAGYGLEQADSYPAKLEAALRARGINARIANAGVSGDTTAAGLQRLAFTLNSQKQAPAVVLISLGGNDMLRGLPPAQTRANLDAILTELGKRKIRAVLMGMLAPPNLGTEYRRAFDTIYPALARKHDAVLVPFFLQAVQGKPDLIQTDRIHPTARGIEEIVAGTVEVVASSMAEQR